MARYRVTVHRVAVYEVDSSSPQAAGEAAVKAALVDPDPPGGFAVIEDAETGNPLDRVDLSKLEPAGSA